MEKINKLMICHLQGGMGNQMFQYAMSKSISKRLGCDLLLNIENFKLDSMRQYSLGLWKGIEEEFTTTTGNIIRENDMPYDQSLVNRISCNSSIIGYWQTEKYFLDIKEDLKKIFIPKESLTPRGSYMENKILEAGDKSVFLTIRRSDYVTSSFHGVLSMDYYNKALEIISEKIKDPIIFVFSDEPEWCKSNLNFNHETIIAGNYDITTSDHLGREDEELWLMRCCKNAIMANSSYSWWGAWLNDSGIVIAPNKWFLSNSKNPMDIIPNHWIKI